MKILVTGAGSGLGFAIADALSMAGHEVLMFDRSIDVSDDVLNPPAYVRNLQELDVLINCAGINANDWFEDVDQSQMRSVMGVNAFGIVNMSQAALPALIKARNQNGTGVIINIVSNASHMAMTSSIAYNASKAAAAMITKQMAHELTPKHGLYVFAISPNKLAGTGMSRQIDADVQRVRGWTKEYADAYQKKGILGGEETPPEAVAEFIANLLQGEYPAYKYMSGCDIPFGK